MHAESRAKHTGAPKDDADDGVRRAPRAPRRWARLGGACAVVGVLSAVVAGIAWERPVSYSRVLHYVQSGSFSYAAKTPAGSVYGRAGLRTGQPVYTGEVTALDVRFSYHFAADAPSAVTGHGELLATMSNGQGITRQFVVHPATAFRGGLFQVRGTLQVSKLDSIARAFAVAAGTSYAGSGYVLTVEPVVRIRASVGAVPLRTSFAPPLSFDYTQNALLPAASTAAAAGGPAATAQGGAPAFTSTSSGQLRVPGARPSTLLVPGLTVRDLRWGALGALVLALLGGAVVGLRLARHAGPGDQGLRPPTRWGSSLVDVEALPEHRGAMIVEMASFTGLLQVARRLECPVLAKSGPIPVYAVVDSGTLYRYRPPAPAIRLTSTEQESTTDLRLSLDGASRG